MAALTAAAATAACASAAAATVARSSASALALRALARCDGAIGGGRGCWAFALLGARSFATTRVSAPSARPTSSARVPAAAANAAASNAPAASPTATTAVELVGAVAHVAAEQVKALTGKLRSLRSQLQDQEAAELWRRRGDALYAMPASAWRRGLSSVELSGGSELDGVRPAGADLVELDPEKDFLENAQLCYKRAEKILRGIEQIGPRLEDCQQDLQRWRSEAERVKRWRTELAAGGGALSAVSAEAVASLHASLLAQGLLRPTAPQTRSAVSGSGGPRKEKAKGVEEGPSFRRKYGKDIDCFRSPGGFEVLCGRSSAANEEVSLRKAKGDEVWFHAGGGIAGSHVLLRASWDAASPKDIAFAARIAAHHSKGRGQKLVPVTYCRGRQVGKDKGSPQGMVTISGKSSTIKVEPGLPE